MRTGPCRTFLSAILSTSFMSLTYKLNKSQGEAGWRLLSISPRSFGCLVVFCRRCFLVDINIQNKDPHILCPLLLVTPEFLPQTFLSSIYLSCSFQDPDQSTKPFTTVNEVMYLYPEPLLSLHKVTDQGQCSKLHPLGECFPDHCLCGYLWARPQCSHRLLSAEVAVPKPTPLSFPQSGPFCLLIIPWNYTSSYPLVCL